MVSPDIAREYLGILANDRDPALVGILSVLVDRGFTAAEINAAVVRLGGEQAVHDRLIAPVVDDLAWHVNAARHTQISEPPCTAVIDPPWTASAPDPDTVYIHENGRMVCYRHGGVYLRAAVDAGKVDDAGMVHTTLGSWAAYDRDWAGGILCQDPRHDDQPEPDDLGTDDPRPGAR